MRFLLPTIISLVLISRSPGEGFLAIREGDPPNHLIPVASPSSDYETSVFKNLYVESGHLGRYTVFPSFGAEYSISAYSVIPDQVRAKYKAVRDIPDSERKYFLTYTAFERNHYANLREGNGANVVTRIDREIDLDFAVAIQRVWGTMLMMTKYPDSYHLGADGATYRFSVFVIGSEHDLNGEVWSPDHGLPRDMVEMGESLVNYLNKKKGNTGDLVTRLRALETKITKANKAALGNPLPRSESDSEGDNKPQPESEGRSR